MVIVILTIGGTAHDGYGRKLRRVEVNGEDVGEAMIAAGLARRYAGVNGYARVELFHSLFARMSFGHASPGVASRANHRAACRVQQCG